MHAVFVIPISSGSVQKFAYFWVCLFVRQPDSIFLHHSFGSDPSNSPLLNTQVANPSLPQTHQNVLS